MSPDTLPTPRFLIGIDGGGTGTRARLVGREGALLGTADAGPSALAQGLAQAWTNIGQAITRAFATADLALPPMSDCALGMGLSGVHSPARRDAFLKLTPQAFGHVAIDTDAFTTLLGAHGGRPGAIVAAGTGSVGEALWPDGRRGSVGGWGFPVGDEASGAWLGLRAMAHAQCALDGRAQPGALARAVWGVAGATQAAVQDWCAVAGQNAYAQLAPLVFEHEADDPGAAALMQLAADDLEAMAVALDPEGRLPLALCGSLGRLLEPRLSAALRTRCVPPAADSAAGAVHLVHRSLGGIETA
jgi:glucosamine kinase